MKHTHEELQSQYENEEQENRRQTEDGEPVSYYDFLPDRLFRTYLRGDEDAGRRALEAVRREVESDLREARR